jgi:hypothetical protein
MDTLIPLVFMLLYARSIQRVKDICITLSTLLLKNLSGTVKEVAGAPMPDKLFSKTQRSYRVTPEADAIVKAGSEMSGLSEGDFVSQCVVLFGRAVVETAKERRLIARRMLLRPAQVRRLLGL